MTVQKQQGDAWQTIGKGVFTAYFDETSSFLALEELDTITKKTGRSVDSVVATVKEKPLETLEVATTSVAVRSGKQVFKMLFPKYTRMVARMRTPKSEAAEEVERVFSNELWRRKSEARRKRDVYQFREFADICRISWENNYFYIFERNGETYRLNCSTAYRAKQVFELFHQKAPDRWDRSSETEE